MNTLNSHACAQPELERLVLITATFHGDGADRFTGGALREKFDERVLLPDAEALIGGDAVGVAHALQGGRQGTSEGDGVVPERAGGGVGGEVELGRGSLRGGLDDRGKGGPLGIAGDGGGGA